jgi:hypothetical protein
MKAIHSSSYPKFEVTFSNNSFEGNKAIVFQIKYCSKSPTLRVAANRYAEFDSPI